MIEYFVGAPRDLRGGEVATVETRSEPYDET